MGSSRFVRLLKFLVPVSIIILCTSAYLVAPTRFTDLTKPHWEKGALNHKEDEARSKASFVPKAADWEIDGPFNGTALTALCNQKKWIEGLHFQCAPGFGGIGNVRNIVLTCVRYAIEAGATTIHVPEIIVRDADLIHLDTGNTLPYDYMFDLDVFNSTLTSACPQIRVVSQAEDLAEFPSIVNKTSKLTAKELGTANKAGRVLDVPKEWRGSFDVWLKKYGAPNGFSAKEPLLVTLSAAFFEFPIRFDTPEFIAIFGRIVQFRHDVRRLAAVVLYALDKKYSLNIDPSASGNPAPHKYYGAHLRTDVDAIAASFASYEEQSTAYLSDAQKQAIPVVYLASGSKPDIQRFTTDAAKRMIKVTTKNALLEDDAEFAAELAEMQKLTWDQQALIDFELLLRSSHFGGTWASSFAFNIAFRRHVVVNDGIWVHTQAALNAKRGLDSSLLDIDTRSNDISVGYHQALASRSKASSKLLKGECYKDTLSTIYGQPGQGIWFELSMWP